MADLILAATTLAARSKPFVIRSEAHASSMQVGLAGAELATLEITPDQGKTWLVVLPAANNDLTVANSTRQILSVGLYSYNKGVSVGPAAIYLSSESTVY